MMEAIRHDPRLIAFSDYAMQLKPYWYTFPREQVRVLTLESFRSDQDGVLRSIFEWLGVDPDFRISGLVRSNATPEIIYCARSGMRWLVCLRHTRSWRKAARILPMSFDKAAYKLSMHRLSRAKFDPRESIEYLRPILAERTGVLSDLLGREFPEWKTTFPCSNGQE